MEIKRNIHLNRIISTIAMLLCICWMPVCAQIRIVDEQDGSPLLALTSSAATTTCCASATQRGT